MHQKIIRHGSLFSGIGGFDLAAEWAGWENVFHCEWNEFGQKVLKYYWPEAISYNDITKTDFTIHRGSIDILSGGFPCQPYSVAGKRLGKEDERHLWPEMLRAIREIQPSYVVAENVGGLISWNGGLVFHEVQTDLENEGYEVQPVILPACAVNAPHRRDRVWFIAHAQSAGGSGLRIRDGKKHAFNGINGNDGDAADTHSDGLQSAGQSRRRGAGPENENIKPSPNTISVGLRGQSNGFGESRFIDKTGARNDWSNFPTESPTRSGNDGIPTGLAGITVSKHRKESIKAYGNAIVPQVAHEIFKVINKMITDAEKIHP